jgi:hypothetical protein
MKSVNSTVQDSKVITYLPNTFLRHTHAIIRFKSLLPKINGSGRPVGIAMIYRNEHHVLRKEIELITSSVNDVL